MPECCATEVMKVTTTTLRAAEIVVTTSWSRWTNDYFPNFNLQRSFLSWSGFISRMGIVVGFKKLVVYKQLHHYNYSL